MYPYGWSAGESPRPRPEFKQFQDLDPRIREAAAMSMQGQSPGETLDWLALAWPEYGEGLREFKKPIEEWLDRLTFPNADNRLWCSMLQCWINCGKDMLRTKLTWTEDYQ